MKLEFEVVSTKSAIQVWICLLWIIALVPGCGSMDGLSPESEAVSDEYGLVRRNSDTVLQNRIFYRTMMIELEITPASSTPSFAWRAMGSKYMVITVFNQKIDLINDTIANPTDAVWTWHSGIGRGREGNVSFSDGADVQNDVILDEVTPLASGDYFIALWGYDDSHDLAYSSREYRYQVP